MKKIFFAFLLLFLFLFSGQLSAQDSCGLYIRTDFDSECLLTTLGADGVPTHVDGSEDCWLACKGNTVNYTAVCDHIGEITWVITGADHFTIDSTGRTVAITWGDGDAGYISASVNIGDSLSCSVGVCIFLIESPRVASTSVPAFYYDAYGFKHIEICQGELIELTDVSSAGSTPITGYLWSSPYGNGSSDHYYIRPSQTGEFSIAHSVQNECGCVDEEKIYVNVVAPTKLDISCHGTACAGTEGTYTADGPNCTQYHWLVEGGSISQGQGTPTITVSWGEPSSGYGVILLDASFCNTPCDALFSVKVPVISDNVDITGPDTVCAGDYEIYSLPAWGGTNYQWTLTSTTGAYIRGGTDPNQCLVEFLEAGTYLIKVNYHCPFLDCGPFTATKKIFVMKRLEIESDVSTLCEDSMGIFTAGLSHTDPGTWCVYDSVNTLIYQVIRDSIHYTFNRPGGYRITVSNRNYCNTAEYSVTVLARPPALTNVIAPHEACPYSTIQLSATPTHPRYYLEWKPLCTDASPSVHDGEEVSVQYGSTVCGVAVYQIDNEYGCPSEAFIHQVDTFRLLPLGIPVDTTVCAGASVDYYVPDQRPNVAYRWTVDPANAASVLDDHLLPHAEVLTNHLYNVPTPYLVDVTIQRTYCSILERYDHVTIHVMDVTPPQLVCPDTVCAQQLSQFSAVGGSSVALYRWAFSDTELTFSGSTIQRAFDTTGVVNYWLTYFPDDGCDSVVVTSSVYVCPTPLSTITISDSVLHVPVQSGVTYAWSVNGVVEPDSTSSSFRLRGYGTYCCTVTGALPCGCSSASCYSHYPPQPDTCGVLHLHCVDSACNTALVSVNETGYGPFTWSSFPQGTDITPNASTNSADLVFHVPGVHTITASSEYNGRCYRGHYHITVDYVLGLELVRNCDGSLTIVDHTIYRSDTIAPIRTITISGIGSQQLTQDSLIIPDSQLNYGLCNVTLSIGNCTLSKEIFIDDLPSIVSIDAPLDVCDQTPVLFSASPDNSSLTYYWNFGDMSYNYGNNIYHSYNMNQVTSPTLTLIVFDDYGCSDTATRQITVRTNNLLNTNLNPTLSNPVCPGSAREIKCQPLTPQPSIHFTWYENGEFLGGTIGTPIYNVYHTGDYRVHILDNVYGCRAEAMCNVGFLNAPTARITGRSEYCYGEEVALSGFSGSQNSYLWTLNDPDIATFTDGNIRFLPTQSGSFLATLSVTNSAPCTATASYAYTVHPQIQPPHISLYGNQCIHQPPVNVRSDTNISLLWSNGFFGDTALYYTPGYISAHYIDSLSGCPSQNAYLFIPHAPNFEALLTGCYYVCEDFLPNKIPIFGLYPYYSQSFHWNWYHGVSLLFSGTQTSPELPLEGFGNYHMEAFYGNGCSVSSPALNIVEKEPCPCDVRVDVKYECQVKECMPNYMFYIIIQNNGPNYSDPVKFSTLTVNSSSTLLSANVLPVVIPPGQTRTITAFVEFHDFENGYVHFTLTDTVHHCTSTFSKKVDWEDCINCECDMNIIGKTFNADLSTPHQTSYFDFTLLFPFNTTGLIDLWTDPPIVLNYLYFPADTARGLLMLDYAALTRLVAEDGKICFHAIICLDNKRLCHAVYCMNAQGLFDLVPADFRQLPNLSEPIAPRRQIGQAQNGPYLVPNPARDEVTVMGLAPESVAEITVLTMDGRQTAVFRSDCRFDVSHITKAIYIVRVVTTDRKVYYLKLVKQ